MNVSRATFVWFALLFLALMVTSLAGLYVLTFRLAAQREMPLIKQLVSVVMRDRLAQDEQYLRDNLSSMAKMVGEMQARLTPLDALGQPLSNPARIPPHQLHF